jgi:hypothetical protein
MGDLVPSSLSLPQQNINRNSKGIKPSSLRERGNVVLVNFLCGENVIVVFDDYHSGNRQFSYF